MKPTTIQGIAFSPHVALAVKNLLAQSTKTEVDTTKQCLRLSIFSYTVICHGAQSKSKPDSIVLTRAHRVFTFTLMADGMVRAGFGASTGVRVPFSTTKWGDTLAPEIMVSPEVWKPGDFETARTILNHAFNSPSLVS